MVNALLNLTYSLVLHRVCCALVGRGLDIQIGFLHSYNTRRPSLGLDLLELFRTQADAFVVTATNRKEFKAKDFCVDASTQGMQLNKEAFMRYLEKFNENLVPKLEIEKEVNDFCKMLFEVESEYSIHE